jgi:hypothetical protein
MAAGLAPEADEAINRFAADGHERTHPGSNIPSTWRSGPSTLRSLRLSGRTPGTTTDLEGAPDDSNTLRQAKAREGHADPICVAVPAWDRSADSAPVSQCVLAAPGR